MQWRAIQRAVLYFEYYFSRVSPGRGLVLTTGGGVSSVAEHVAELVVARERRGRIASKFHIGMQMSLSYGCVGFPWCGLVLQSLRVVYFLAPLVDTGSDLSMFCSVVNTFINNARASRGAVRCTVSNLKVILSIENVRPL